MIKRETFSKALTLIRDYSQQLCKIESFASDTEASFLIIHNGSNILKAIDLLFKESFQVNKPILDWWLYDSQDHEVYIGDIVYNATDPGAFYDLIVKYRQDWKEQRQCNGQAQQPIMISKDCFCQIIDCIRKEQESSKLLRDMAIQCKPIFTVTASTSPYLDAAILLLKDLFDDHYGILRWCLATPKDHRMRIEEQVYNLDNPAVLYTFLLAHPREPQKLN